MKNILSLLAVTILFVNSVMAQNDLCDNAVTLTPNTACSFATGSFNGATISSPAPSCAASASQDVWFKFVATNPTNRIFLEGVFGLNHGFEVIEGNCSGTSVFCVNNDGTGESEASLTNTFTVGQTYFIRVFKATAGITTDNFRICIETFPTPTNDLCSNATVITPNTACTFTTSVFSGSNISTPAPSCASAATQDVWFQFVTSSPTNRIFLEGIFGLNVGFEVFEGSCAGTSILCVNNDGTGEYEAILTDTFTVGQTYFIRVFKATAGITTGNFRICIETFPTPTNDLCSNATVITPNIGCTFTTSVFSGSNISTPAPSCAAAASQDVWFQFVASSPTNRIFLEGVFGLNVGFEVFEGSCTGTSVFCINNDGIGESEATLTNTFTVGQTYFIRVFKATAGITTGNFRICVETFPSPINDLCANATVISPTTTCVNVLGSFAGSSLSTTSPACAVSAAQDVWYQFVATINSLTITLAGVSSLNHGFELFDACGGSSIACINVNGTDISESTTVTNLIVGNTYLVRVFTTTPSLTFSNFSICIFGSVLSTCTPVVSIAASPTAICQGTSLTFNATPSFGGSTPAYQWKVNSNNVGVNSPSFSTTALNNGDQVSCVLTSNAACATSATATSNVISIVVNSLPTVSITFTGGVLTATAGYSTYQWTLNGVIIPDQLTNSFVPTQTGLYAVTVNDINNCSNATSFNLTSLSTESFDIAKVVFYPNPVKNLLNFTSTTKVNNISVFDMTGRLLYSEKVQNNAIDLSVLQTGNYLVEFTTLTGSNFVKIVKE